MQVFTIHFYLVRDWPKKCDNVPDVLSTECLSWYSKLVKCRGNF